MNTKFFLVAGLAALATLAFTMIVWPLSLDTNFSPPASLMPLFMGVGFLSSVTFGIGIAFLIFGHKPMRRVESGHGLTFWTFVSTIWILISWWPHENLHRVVDENNYYTLIWIEYGFHVTVYIAGIIVAAYLLKQFKNQTNNLS